MNTVDLANWLKENVKWSKYITLVDTVGDELNERKLRFDKSDLFERSLEMFSEGKLQYVNKEGVDHIGPEGITIEMKYGGGSLFTNKTKKPKKHVADLQLMNSRGSSYGRTLPDSYADYLLICDKDSVALISKQDLLPFVVDAGDGLKTSKMPSSVVTYVFKPGEFELGFSCPNYSYSQAKTDMQTEYLSLF